MFDALIADASARYNVPESWIRGFIQVESGGNPGAYNPSDPGGAWGLMQIIAATARGYGVTDLTDLFDPAVNIDVGTHLLHDLIVRFGPNLEAVASAYNSGSATLWQTDPEVHEYVQRILGAVESGVKQGAAALFVIGAVFLYFQFRKRRL